MAQFVYNNLFHLVISITSFMAAKGFTFHSETEVFDAFIHKMTALKTGCKQNIHYTQEHMTEQANCHWNSAPNY